MSERVVVITGASGGIGAALAERLAVSGVSLVLVARRADALEAVAARCVGMGAHAGIAAPLCVTADVTSRAAVQGVVADALARFGGIDVWVNNVGQGISRMPSELTDDDIDDMISVNVKSALYGMQETLPHFRARGAGQVINVSSMLGRMPFAVQRSAYCGSKHFLNSLTQNFRAEVQQTHPGIQVTLVSPGVVRTDFGNNARYGGVDSRTMPDSQSAEEVAAVIADVMESRAPDVYTRVGAQGRVAAFYAAIGTDPTDA